MSTRLGRIQLRIMHVLWDRREATARQVTDALNRRGRIAHSTVQTLLRKLEAKGVVGHRRDRRTFIFFPRIARQQITRTATRDLIERLFGGSAAGLVAHILAQERIPEGELARLRELIEKQASDQE